MRHSRFDRAPSELLTDFSESVSYDWQLYRQDIAGSIAHARALLQANLLTADEFAQIQQGLRAIEREIEQGNFPFDPALEDVHMNIEAELTKRIGKAGAKLHTARSRNDQVATDTRLFCREALTEVNEAIRALQLALIHKAREYHNAPVPGYTHLQRGQPVTLGHHLLAYVEMLGRDAQRLADAQKRLNISPLGSGALAGSTINLNRPAIAQELGFSDITHNSMDAIADRDYLAEILFCLALIGTHLSRLSEDLILWCSAEFNFATLADRHTTGSSLMPQKKNPDICELTRGKTGRLYGNLLNLLTVLKGLPLTYNRDLQEDKEPLFDSLDTVLMSLQLNAEMISEMSLNRHACAQAAADPMLLATDLADHLVQNGIPFRQAHDLVGKAVAHALTQGLPLDQVDFPQLDPAFPADCAQVFQLERALQTRSNPGSPNPQNVLAEIERWQETLTTQSSPTKPTGNNTPEQ